MCAGLVRSANNLATVVQWVARGAVLLRFPRRATGEVYGIGSTAVPSSLPRE
jgi:hypothetical protein